MEVDTDTDIEELKELVRRNTLLAQETNHMVKSMRRSQRVHTLMSVVWWLLILGVSAYSYYTYVQPYVDQITRAYGSEQNLQSQVTGYFNQFFGTSTKH